MSQNKTRTFVKKRGFCKTCRSILPKALESLWNSRELLSHTEATWSLIGEIMQPGELPPFRNTFWHMVESAIGFRLSAVRLQRWEGIQGAPETCTNVSFEGKFPAYTFQKRKGLKQLHSRVKFHTDIQKAWNLGKHCTKLHFLLPNHLHAHTVLTLPDFSFALPPQYATTQPKTALKQAMPTLGHVELVPSTYSGVVLD